jgi:hypothetical protein
MKALAHNLKNLFMKLVGANKCCVNKQTKEKEYEVPADHPYKTGRPASTPIYRNKHGYPEDIGEFGRNDETRT